MQLFDQLLQFPLFQGMSRDDLSQVAERTKFDFLKLQPGNTIVAEDDTATHLHFLLAGTVITDTTSDDRSYSVTEYAEAPLMLQPEVLFGYNQRYTRTSKAYTQVSLLRLDKKEVTRLSQEFMVFRINLLNIFATQSQRAARQPWRRTPTTLRDRIVMFFNQHCVHPVGQKIFHILMNTLAAELNDSRLNVSRQLNALERNGLIVLKRGMVVIPHLEALNGVRPVHQGV